MLSEGTLLSGGEKDRKIAAWDSLQNYKRITDCKVCKNTIIIHIFYLKDDRRVNLCFHIHN